MSGTFAIAAIGDGYPLESAGYSREEADLLAADLAVSFDLEKPPGTFDLLPELERRFPAGAPVWLGTRVHWRRGQSGTVTPAVPESHARWPEGGEMSPWFVSNGGASVHVRLADGSEGWWPATWLETRGA